MSVVETFAKLFLTASVYQINLVASFRPKNMNKQLSRIVTVALNGPQNKRGFPDLSKVTLRENYQDVITLYELLNIRVSQFPVRVRAKGQGSYGP